MPLTSYPLMSICSALIWGFFFKMKKIILFFLSVTLFITANLYAQDTTIGLSCPICIGGEHVNPTPYDLSFKQELPFLVVGATLITSGYLIYLLNKTEPFSETELNTLNSNQVNIFDRSAINHWSPGAAKLSNFVRSGVTLLPAFFISNHHTRQDIRALSVMAVEVFTTTFGITLLTKNLTNRTRPLVYNPEVPLSERTNERSRFSFFSGHTSHTAAASFFFAKVMADYHPNMKIGFKTGIWVISAAIPAVAAYLRVKAGKHFPTDVMTGYVVGALTGYLIPHFHKQKKGTQHFSWYPIPSKHGIMMNMGIRF